MKPFETWGNQSDSMISSSLLRQKHLATEEIQFQNEAGGEVISRPILLCLSGVQAGLLQPIEFVKGRFLVGRDEEQCALFIDSPEISRQHAHIVKGPDQQLRVMDLNSTNGVFVNNTRVDAHALKPNDRIRFGPHSYWKFFYQDVEEYEYYQQLYSNACKDHLTGALNRRSFERSVGREISFSMRHKRRVTIAICDIDHFKKINDTYGHAAGDQVLKEFVERLQSQIRREDLLARHGGEEFVLMIREVTGEQSLILLERLRQAISKKPFQTQAGVIDVTVSIGTVTCEPEHLDGFNYDAILQLADESLYEAKESGRNRICQASCSF